MTLRLLRLVFRATPRLRRIGAATIVSTGTAYLLYNGLLRRQVPIRVQADEGATTPPKHKRNQFNFIAETAERASPSVVYIETYQRHMGRPIRVGSGSGFLIAPNGAILTNAHVVSKSSDISVRLHDGSTYAGTIEAIDSLRDLALVRIEPKANETFPHVPLGSSRDVRVGEWVVAIGSPMSLTNTVTAGIVSTVGRASEELGLGRRDIEYVQTDAAITVGNSGGPLVNLDGQVIGINTMTSVPGFSFAIPVDLAKEFISRRRQGNAKEQYRYIGVSVLSLNRDLAYELKNSLANFPDISSGVLIAKIIEGSPAHRAGLNAGDVILEVNSKRINRASELINAVKTQTQIRFKVQRGSRTFFIDIMTEPVM